MKHPKSRNIDTVFIRLKNRHACASQGPELPDLFPEREQKENTRPLLYCYIVLTQILFSGGFDLYQANRDIRNVRKAN
jgi:hypothetical protein